MLSSVKLIAEPWDCGPGGYQVGGFPPGWAEWNDRFRDTVRAFWKGDEGQACGAGAAADGVGRPVQPARPQAVGQRQLHHRARRLHAARPGLATTTSTTRPTARTTATAQRQPLVESWRRRARPTIRRSAAARAPEAQHAGHACCSPGHADARRPVTSSAAPSRATTTPIARTTRSTGWTSRALTRTGAHWRRSRGS